MRTAALRQQGTDTHDVDVSSLTTVVGGDSGSALGILMGAVVILLVVACANVANLLLARAAARQREFAVRQALGAGRSRLLTQVAVESVVRGLSGGALGLGLALAASWAMHRYLVVSLPRFAQVSIDGRVLAVAAAVSLLTSVAFGLAPALRMSRVAASGVVREGGRGVVGDARGERLRRSLVVLELALSFVVLVSAGLLVRSVQRLMSVPIGFDASHLMSASVSLPPTSYPDSTAQREFASRSLAAVSAIPGVQSVALASSLPVEGGVNGGVMIDGVSFPKDAPAIAEKRIVSTNYFHAMGARVIAGRGFDDRDSPGAQPVVVVNRSFVKHFLEGRNPIGQLVDFEWGTQGEQTIVGVISDMRESALNAAEAPAIYIPVRQRPTDSFFFVIRSAGDPTALMGAVRAATHRIDPAIAFTDIRSVSDVLVEGISSQRLSAAVLGAFAVLALVLAVVGLFGVISYAVVQRTQEFGIRAALGARPVDIVRLVGRDGAPLAATGLVLGTLVALAATRLLASQLFGIGATDPLTYAMVAGTLGLAALAATFIPALRAVRVDPLDALHNGA